jgi:hypothetical protein
MGNKLQSDFLFARSSFASGMACSVDLWGQSPLYNEGESASEADANAIFSDWAMIGQDLVDALELAKTGKV